MAISATELFTNVFSMSRQSTAYWPFTNILSAGIAVSQPKGKSTSLQPTDYTYLIITEGQKTRYNLSVLLLVTINVHTKEKEAF